MTPSEWIDQSRQTRDAALADAVNHRDMSLALDVMGITDRRHCFVWPDVYEGEETYASQNLDWGCHAEGMPLVMRAAKTTIRERYGKADYVQRLAELYLSFFKITVVDREASEIFREAWGKFADRHRLSDRYFPVAARNLLHHCVYVQGRVIPLDRDRIRVLEKSIKVVEKIDRLRAA